MSHQPWGRGFKLISQRLDCASVETHSFSEVRQIWLLHCSTWEPDLVFCTVKPDLHKLYAKNHYRTFWSIRHKYTYRYRPSSQGKSHEPVAFVVYQTQLDKITQSDRTDGERLSLCFIASLQFPGGVWFMSVLWIWLIAGTAWNTSFVCNKVPS